MFIQVIAQNPGHASRYRAGRQFLVNTKYRLEVIDGKEDFKGADGLPDMARINRAGFEALKADPQFSVLSDGDTGASISADLFDAVKRQAADLASQLSSARVEISRLEIENQRLQVQLAEAEKALGDLDDDVDPEEEAPPAVKTAVAPAPAAAADKAKPKGK
jgi:hypothetical protein